MQFNILERFISDQLRSFPRIKQALKFIYQLINYWMFKQPFTLKQLNYKTITKITINNEESFFGYYDKSPINNSNQFILFHSLNHEYPSYKSTKENAAINICYYDINKSAAFFIDTSTAYNLQQGSRLQWINNTDCIYNVFNPITNYYESVIYNVAEQQVLKTIPFPIYDTHQNFALSLRFERLHAMRPEYGYPQIQMSRETLDDLTNDGIYFIDLETGAYHCSLTLRDIAAFKSAAMTYPKNTQHKINHIMISPDGQHVMFLHRYFINHVKHDRLILAAPNGKPISVMADHGMVSHCCWKNPTTIIAYMHHPSAGNNYYSIDIQSNTTSLINQDLGQFGDGHPSVYNHQMVFDTYPNKSRHKTLSLYNLVTTTKTPILSAFESLRYFGETRCDLHPRWSPDGSTIFMDSVHEGRRHLYSISLR